jgi:hypothetical protein
MARPNWPLLAIAVATLAIDGLLVSCAAHVLRREASACAISFTSIDRTAARAHSSSSFFVMAQGHRE